MTIRLLALTFGFALVAGAAYAGPLPGGADTDSDGVEDAFDNCTTMSNTSQTDSDHNGCGNTCTCSGSLGCGQASVALTCDTDMDTVIGSADFSELNSQFGSTSGGSADCDADTVVGSADFSALNSQFGNSVGMSGITSAQCNPATCQCTPQ